MGSAVKAPKSSALQETLAQFGLDTIVAKASMSHNSSD